MSDPRTKLIALLIPLAPDLAERLWAVRDARDLTVEIRGTIVDVLGHEAASRGLDADGTPNRLVRELDELPDALRLDEQATRTPHEGRGRDRGSREHARILALRLVCE